MGSLHRFFVMTWVLLLSLSTAYAGGVSQKELFAGYLNSKPYKRYLEAAFNQGEAPVLKNQCPSLRLIKGNQYTLIKQPKFVKAGSGYSLSSGVWIARAVMDRCGKRVIRRALLEAKGGDQNLIKPTFLLNGEFQGNLKLEYDARRIVFPALAAYGNCDKPNMVSVLDIKAPGPSSPKGWSEIWIARSCDSIVEVDVSYTATKDGMAIAAKKRKVTKTGGR